MVQLSAAERAYIETKYGDCLCAACLLSLQKEYSSRLKENDFIG
jgi:hypothetical protein